MCLNLDYSPVACPANCHVCTTCTLLVFKLCLADAVLQGFTIGDLPNAMKSSNK